MGKADRTLLVDGYQPKSPKGHLVSRDSRTGKVAEAASSSKKLPKTTSAVTLTQRTNKKK